MIQGHKGILAASLDYGLNEQPNPYKVLMK